MTDSFFITPFPSPPLPNPPIPRILPAPVEITALPLFDSAFLAKLEQLYLLSKKLFRGAHRAERRSRQTGSSLEFADYRNYTAGDDLRSIDWNIYGRLDRLFIKLFEHEQNLDISFLIDASASMRWTENAQHSTPNTQLSKLDQARRITASLAYIALANLDRVNIHWFASQLGDDMGLSRGKSQFHKVLDFLRDAPALTGDTRLLPTVRAFTQRMKRRGLVFLLSDLFDPRGVDEALALLRFQRFEVHVIHILDPAELRPTATATHCAERGIAYAQATTAVPFEDLVLRVLRDGRMVQ